MVYYVKYDEVYNTPATIETRGFRGLSRFGHQSLIPLRKGLGFRVICGWGCRGHWVCLSVVFILTASCPLISQEGWHVDNDEDGRAY